MDIGAVAVGFIGSILANLVFFVGAVTKFIKKIWQLRRLRRFWGKPKDTHTDVYLFYPSYPSPRVGRTEKRTGYYLSDEDATAVELLERSLTEIGFSCHRRISDTGGDLDRPFPKEGTIILICGPKFDTTQNCVGYDPFIGGNPVSSWFYLRYHKGMEIELSYNHGEGRKEYHLPGNNTVCSGLDENPANDIDRGLLIRTEIRGQRFVLCWGIHGPATLAAVKAGLDPSCLQQLTELSGDVIATVDAVIDKASDIVRPIVRNVQPLVFSKEPVPGLKPDPFSVGKYLEREKPVYGLSYLWATPDNIHRIKSGDYHHLTPIAAELDPSLKCPYSCNWCAYRSSKSDNFLMDESKALAIVEKLAGIGIKLVVLTGGGEPLESPCIEAIAERCREKDMLVTLYTN